MEFDREFFESIKKMDDNTLSGAIQAIAAQMGVDQNLVQYYLRDMGKVKEAVSGLDKEDFNKIQTALGEEKTDEVFKQIRSQMQGE